MPSRAHNGIDLFSGFCFSFHPSQASNASRKRVAPTGGQVAQVSQEAAFAELPGHCDVAAARSRTLEAAGNRINTDQIGSVRNGSGRCLSSRSISLASSYLCTFAAFRPVARTLLPCARASFYLAVILYSFITRSIDWSQVTLPRASDGARYRVDTIHNGHGSTTQFDT